MKDAYSAHKTTEEALDTLKRVSLTYLRFFKRIGLPVKICNSQDLAMSQDAISFEFVLEDSRGEGKFTLEEGTKHGVDYSLNDVEGEVKGFEIGHIFYLGDVYSKSFNYLSAQGIPLKMGSYGIGLTRLLEVKLLHEEKLS